MASETADVGGALDAPAARPIEAGVLVASDLGSSAEKSVTAGPRLLRLRPGDALQVVVALPTSPPQPSEEWHPPAPIQTTSAASQAPLEHRWSGDSWLFLRAGSVAALSGAAAPSYGASQAGAVIRYHLAPDSVLRPTAYLRAASALGAVRQKEVAVGMSIRPLLAIPVALMGEARISDDAAGRHVRPAAMLVTEIALFRLPGNLEGEVYAQGGYIAGRDATPFGDAQARITRRVISRRRVHFDVGGGAWAGGQRGAARVDLGPTASLSLPLGAGSARIAADWRLRVAGDATPASGPALTISAGF